MKLFHFEVLQKHIDAGVQGNVDRCPVALTIKEAGHECSVGDEIIIDGKRYSCPQTVSNFISDFDGDYWPPPFAFDLTDENLIDPQFLIEEDDASL